MPLLLYKKVQKKKKKKKGNLQGKKGGVAGEDNKDICPTHFPLCCY